MKAIIAEKPSVARAIAQLLKANHWQDGYFTGSDYCITWALGHLILNGMSEEYGQEALLKPFCPYFPIRLYFLSEK